MKAKVTELEREIVGRVITLSRVIKKRSKKLIPKMNQRGLRVTALKGSIEKSPILLSHYR